MSYPPYIELPTLAGCLASSERNRDIAERQVEATRQNLQRHGAADPVLLHALSRFKAEHAHWADYVGYYRARVAREGAPTVPAMLGIVERPAERKPVRPAPILEPDRRLPRERDAGDDDLDSDLPF